MVGESSAPSECTAPVAPVAPSTCRTQLRQPKVQDLDLAVAGQRDVRGLQIAVNDPLLVGSLERLRDLSGNVERFVDRDRATREAFVQALAVHELEHEKLVAIRFVQSVDCGDVRMIQRGEDAALRAGNGRPAQDRR